MNAYWISWYHHPDDGEFELHTPWWISGTTMEETMRPTIVAAVQAPSEEAAWEVIHQSYDTPPTRIETRFCNQLEDREQQPSARQPWTPEDGRFPRADWMQWPD
jgi:hypothetical protein